MVKDLHSTSQSANWRERVLVVDDDSQILKQIQWALSGEYEILMAASRNEALEIFLKQLPRVVLLDLGLPPFPREATEGLLTLENFLAQDPYAKVIIVSGNSERQNALLAIEKGAYDIFPKPIDIEELRTVLRRVFLRLQLENESMEVQRETQFLVLEEIIGSSPQMQSVASLLRKVAPTEIPLLITGESGTGKELIASAIHKLSPRKDGAFTPLNCAAIPENLLESELFGHEKGAFTGAVFQRRGKLEYARGGTLFLDEIGELAPPLQAKILRFLQEKIIERVGGRELIPVDARVIAATNQDLENAVKEERFREDLYFRLAVVKIALPPLRDRGDDVIRLAEHFARVYASGLKRPIKKFSKQACEAMRAYTWPGNVRELQNRVRRALVLTEGLKIGPGELELDTSAGEPQGFSATLKEARQELEREMVKRTLEAHQGNVSRAARALGVSRPTLYDLINKYKLT